MPSRRSPSESSFSSASALSTLSSRLSMRTPVCTRSISSMVHRYHGTWIRARLDHMDSTLDDVALWEGFVGACLPPAEWTHRAPMRHYSRDRLLSIEARARFIEPDLLPLFLTRPSAIG